MSSNPATPNILFIFTDQHRLSGVGCYGDTPCRTPNIDRLAAAGIRFENAYTVCPVCSPARGSIMTGLYPHSHGICSNIYNLGCSVHELIDSPTILSRRLQSTGYQCGYSGKWHLGEGSHGRFDLHNKASLPSDVGFKGQNFPGHGDGGFRYPEYKEYLNDCGLSHEVNRDVRANEVWPSGILSGPVESTVPYFLTQNTLDLMKDFSKNDDKPFFIWHNFWGPHSPYYVPEEFYNLYKDVDIPPWPNFDWKPAETSPCQVKTHPDRDKLTWDDWAEAIRYYYAFVSLIDCQIGRLLDYLDESGLAENTIVVFSADHGETLGSHGGLTDKGWHHFEEIQRIPMIIKIPEKFQSNPIVPGSTISRFVSLLDLYPSFLDYANAPDIDYKAQGSSLRPLLEKRETEWRDSIFIEFYGVNNLATSMVTVRCKDIKYGWNCSNIDELYDLNLDPSETINVISDPQYSAVLRELRRQMADWMRETQHPASHIYTRNLKI